MASTSKNEDKLLFSIEKNHDGRFRVTANSGQCMTYLVCECESGELAMFLVNEFNQLHEEAKRKLVASVSADPDASAGSSDALMMA